MAPACSQQQTNRQETAVSPETVQAVQKAKEPVKDKALLDMLSLYRARRYESLADAISSPDTVYKLILHGQKLGKIAPEIVELNYLNSRRRSAT